jgi:thiamine-monophosphate kinase
VTRIEDSRLGFDEDASDIPLTDDTSIVINVDTFVGGTDWLPGMSEAQVGRKTAVMALSDLAAKGASPIATMLSLCVPGDQEVSSTEELIRGFSQYCLKVGVPFIGGDVGLSRDTILTGIAIGKATPKGIITRGGCNLGDIIAVTEPFGLTSAAFKILLEGLKSPERLQDLSLQAAYKPNIHPNLVQSLVEEKAISASMDSSDGLAITLNTIASQSGMRIEVDKIPAADGLDKFAKEHNLDLLDLIMNGGEEFSLVLAIPSDMWETATDVARQQHISLLRVGQVCEGEGVVWIDQSAQIEIPARGYDSFREWDIPSD